MDLEKTRPITFKPNDWTIPEIVREYEYMIVMEEDVDEYNQELKQKVDPDVFPIKFYGRILSKNKDSNHILNNFLCCSASNVTPSPSSKFIESIINSSIHFIYS